MAVTRINNNQITDASAGNVFLGINANTKLQNFSITSNKIANNLTYGSDLTVAGNLTVQGSSTAIDTTITTIEDPVIVLASTQTGAPAVDIGFIGERGTSNNIAFVWDESSTEFVTAFTSTAETNTTITITTYANFHTNDANIGGNAVINGTTSLVGNLVGAVNATANITGGNLRTAGQVSATGNITSAANITGANILTGGIVSATSTITGGNVLTGGDVSATGNITGGNIISGNAVIGNINVSGDITVNSLTANTFVSAIGNVQAGNVRTAGLISATGTITSATTITGGNLATGGTVSATANITGGNVLTGGLISSTGNLTAGNVSTAGTVTAASTVGGVITGSSSSVTGTQTAASTVGGVITGSSSSVTGTQTAASTVGGVITGSSSSVTGTQTAASTVGGVITGSSSSVTGTQTAASTVGGVITGSNVSVTGNVNGANVNTNNIVGTGITITSTGALNLAPTGNITANSKNITGLADPVQDQDAATKFYVDSVAQGLDPKASCLYATAAALPAYTYNNGTSGVGATITLNATGNLTIDGNVVSSGQRVLIKNETSTNAPYNGIYLVTTAGATGVAAVLTRAADFNQPAEIPSAFTFIEFGSTQADTGWVCTTNAPVTIGTTDIIFVQFSGAGTYTAGAGLTLTGTQFNVLTDGNSNPTIGINGSNQVVVPAGAAFITPNIGAATGTSLSATGTVTAASTVGGVITGTSTSVTGTQTAASTVGGVITGTSASLSGNVTGGNILSSGLGSFTGNVTAANFFGNITGNIDAAGANTQVQFNDGDLLGASAGFTFNKTANLLTVAGNVAGGNVTTGGQVSATGNATLGNVGTNQLSLSGNVISALNVTGNITGANLITPGNVYAPAIVNNGTYNTQIQLGAVSGIISVTTDGNSTQFGPSGAITLGGASQVIGGTFGGSGITLGTSQTDIFQNRDGNVTIQVGTGGATTSTWTFANSGNLLAPGNISAVGNITGANLILTTGIVDGPAAGRITINGSDIDTDFAVDGDTLANVFYVDAGTGTASFGSSTQVTNAIVNFAVTTSIKAPVGNTAQRPATGVTGMLRFNTTNNALEVYDNSAWTSVGVPVFTVIADQQFNGDGTTVAFTLSSTQTTNSCIVSINGVVQIPTLAYAVAGTNPTCVLTFTEAPAVGDIIDVRQITTTTTVTQIVNTSGNAIVAVSDTAAQVNVTGDLSVSGTILGGNLNSTAITFGTSNMSVVSSGGNIRANIAGTTVQTISPGLVAITGDLSVSGNATLSGNILGDRIQNGTTQIDIQTPSGNANINIGGTGNLAVFSPGALNMTGNIIPTANITYDLGTNTNRWKDIWLSNSTIYLGNSQISANATSLIFTNPSGGQTVLAGATSSITGASVSVTGTVTAASVVGGVITGSSSSVTGAQTAASTVGGVITGSSASVSGAVTAASTVGGVITGSSASVTGNVTGVNHFGTNTSVTGTQTAASTVGGVMTGSSVSVTGTINGTTVTGTSLTVSTGNITGGNLLLSGAIQDSGQLDIQTTASNSNIVLTPNGTGNVNTGANVSVTGRVTAASTVGGVITGSSVSVTGAQTAASTVGGVITGSSSSVTGAQTAASTVGGVITGSSTSVTGTTTAASVVGGVITGSSLSVTGTINGTTLTGTSLTVSTGNITGGNLILSGAIEDSGQLDIRTTASNGNIVLTPNGTGAIVVAKDIVNGQANGVGNIGSSSTRFNQVFALASSAQYADLAEKYTADAAYAPGTVVVFGGTAEVTVDAVDSDRRVAGIVSTNPAYIMNDGLDAAFVATVALTGRVPCQVVGSVRKGDMMVAAGLGRARAEADPRVGTVIGKALEDFDGAEGTIEVVVGRF